MSLHKKFRMSCSRSQLVWGWLHRTRKQKRSRKETAVVTHCSLEHLRSCPQSWGQNQQFGWSCQPQNLVGTADGPSGHLEICACSQENSEGARPGTWAAYCWPPAAMQETEVYTGWVIRGLKLSCLIMLFEAKSIIWEAWIITLKWTHEHMLLRSILWFYCIDFSW